MQSYPLLQTLPSDTSALLLLQQISSQLNSFSYNPPFINSTQTTRTSATAPAPQGIPRSAVWLNILWFSSLILSLSSASICIMVKQWLHEYKSGLTGESRQTAILRQHRLNNLIAWKVADIVTGIPVLLQVALGLFLAGLLVLLWSLHPAVAAVTSVLVGNLAIFTISTTVLPLIKPGCAYLSPQILALYSVWQSIVHGARRLRYVSMRGFANAVDSLYRRTQIARLRVVSRILCIHAGLGHMDIVPWRGRERAVVTAKTEHLKTDLIAMAYDVTLSPEALSAAAVCMMASPAPHVIDGFRRLQVIDIAHRGAVRLPPEHFIEASHATQLILWSNFLLCAYVQAKPDSSSYRSWWKAAGHLDSIVSGLQRRGRLLPGRPESDIFNVLGPARTDWVVRVLLSRGWPEIFSERENTAHPGRSISVWRMKELGRAGYAMALSAANHCALPPRAALCCTSMCRQLCDCDCLTDDVLLSRTVNAFHLRLIQEILTDPAADSFDGFAEYMRQIQVYLDAVPTILPAPPALDCDLPKSERQIVCAWLRHVLLDLLCALRDYVVSNPMASATNGPARLAQAARRGRPLEHRDSHDRVFQSTINSIVQTIASQPLLFGPLLPQDIPPIPDASEDESSASVRAAHLAYGYLERLSGYAREPATTQANPNETQYVVLIFCFGGWVSMDTAY